jgi:fido (protein-threonine AMPylation protein)
MFISEGSSSKAKYEALEYFNIENVEKKMGKVSFSEVSQKLLCDLHYDLCAGLDDFSKELGVAKYHAGTFRRSNSVKVGKFPPYIPPKSKEIPKLLDALFLEFSQKKDISLSDIIEFHFLLYATHPFQNGNKRVCRILESLMIESYGFSAEGTLSLSVYYKKKKSGFHSLLIQSLQRKNPESFVNFALRGYFYAGKHILNNCISIFQETFSRNYTNLLLGILGQEAKDKRYADALRTILELHCSFSHTEFMTKMNEFGYSKGQSQQIIAFLKANEILQQAEKKYFIPGALEINEYALRINKFFLKNGIHTEE